MNRQIFCILALLILLLVLTDSAGCGQTGGRIGLDAPGAAAGESSPVPEAKEELSAMFKGTVVDIINAGRYAYLQVDTGEALVWVAVPAFDGKIGDVVLVPPGVPVADFRSRKLDREFDLIYFVGGVRRVGEDNAVLPEDTPQGNQ